MEKRKILVGKLKRGDKFNKKEVIGVLGAYQGVGVTYSCIMLAQYLRQEYAASVAIVELNGQNDYSCLYEAYYTDIIQQKDMDNFMISGVTYYPNKCDSEIARIVNEEFHYIILDFGSNMRKYGNELLRCNTKIVIGNLLEWRKKSLYNLINQLTQYRGYKDWIYLVTSSNKQTLQEIKKEFSILVHPINYISNPFVLPMDIIRLFESIL